MRYYWAFCLLLSIAALSSCAHMLKREPHTADLKQICYRLRQELALANYNSINYPNRTPAQQATLNRQYYHYQCDDVLHQ